MTSTDNQIILVEHRTYARHWANALGSVTAVPMANYGPQYVVVDIAGYKSQAMPCTDAHEMLQDITTKLAIMDAGTSMTPKKMGFKAWCIEGHQFQIRQPEMRIFKLSDMVDIKRGVELIANDSLEALAQFVQQIKPVAWQGDFEAWRVTSLGLPVSVNFQTGMACYKPFTINTAGGQIHSQSGFRRCDACGSGDVTVELDVKSCAKCGAYSELEDGERMIYMRAKTEWL